MILNKKQAKIMKETAIMKTFRGMPYWVLPTNEKGRRKMSEKTSDREEWINSFSGIDGRSTIGKRAPIVFGDNGRPETIVDRKKLNELMETVLAMTNKEGSDE